MNSEVKSVKSVKSVVESVESVESVGACPASCCPVQILQQLVSNIDPELAKSLVGALADEIKEFKEMNAKKKADAARIRRRDELLQLDQNYADDKKKLQDDRERLCAEVEEWARRFEEAKKQVEAMRIRLEKAEAHMKYCSMGEITVRNSVDEYDKRIKELEAKRVAVYQEWNNGGYAAL